MIVIKGNEASEYYANHCIKSWKNFGINVKKFDAITPDDLPNNNFIKWKEYSDQDKYLLKGLKVPITDTEKACFTSHYMLWKKSAEENIPILVLEHDAYLETPENLWYDTTCGMIYFDKAAMGSYVIMPWFAKIIMDAIEMFNVGSGPYGFLYAVVVKYELKDLYVNDRHPLYVAASNQVMSKKYGNTIDHYYNSQPDLIKRHGKHKFIMI